MPAFVNEQHTANASSTSASLSFTPGSNVNFIVVDLHTEGPVSGVSVTYDGVAMTLLASALATACYVYTYYITNPPAGAKTVAASWTTARPNQFAARGYSSVDTASPIRNTASATGVSTTPSCTVPSAVGDLVIDSVGSGGGATAGAGQTLEYNYGAYFNSNGSHESGAASVVMSWTQANSWWSIVAFSLKPAASSGFFMFF